ncbi:TonB-dependent receptor [Pseudoxanthomonas sp. 22568]|uniref:TonB-dependent receptor n=1 Tax=Pseudoxanthomonas sp. 22568 TaxID=3453945 RepID=UPI003F867F0C
MRNRKSSLVHASIKRTALSLALGACFVGGVHAQSNTSGAVVGQAASGDTITVVNPSTGFTRTITVGGDGSYRFSALPTGKYTVTRKATDGSTSSRDISVNIGTAATVSFVSAGGGDATTLGAVTVTGTGFINPIDVSSVESTTILTSEQIAKLPVPRDITSVALLAPGTVRGDAAFGNLASFGGASVAENAYFINGFNVTNSFRNLNFAQVPFEGIAEQQIKTGGYGAEFGRSLGGVINLVTKRGSNEFHAGGNVFYSPDSMRSAVPNAYLRNGTLRSDNSKDSEENATVAVWASGALVKDRLFAYGLLQYGRTEADSWGNVLAFNNTYNETKTPTWLAKLDWYLTDNHVLELTAFSDKTETDSDVYGNTPGVLNRTGKIGTVFTENGGENYVLKYTGYLTDNFTLSALYGHGEFSRSVRMRTASGLDVSYGGDLNVPATGCPVIVDARPGYRRALTGTYGSTCNISANIPSLAGAIDRVDSGDTRDQFRIDAEWQLGDHLVKFGFDLDDYESIAGTSIEGGRAWRYSTIDPDTVANSGDETDIVREQIVNQGATVKVEQRAFYIQDNWNITDNFMAYVGLRWDSFNNKNGAGQSFVKIDNQFGPRLGFSWDVNGDSTFKIFGNAGRYALPLTPSVAVRGASASLFTRQNFNYVSVDPVTGAPIDPVARGPLSYINGEFGVGKNPATIAAKNLDPMYQDEFILGFQAQLTDHFSLGVRGIYRDLKQAIDDTCDYSPIMAANGFELTDDGWVNANGDVANIPGAGFPYCRMFNPGKDAVFVTDLLGNGQLTTNTIDGALLSPKAKRTYSAMEVFFEGSWDNFFLQGSYTYAKSKGNTEGGVKSDIGQDDTSVTQDFDYLELTTDTYGYLPNDRRHSLKVFGNYQFNEEWSLGANLLIQSGRPVNCLGVLTLPDGSLHGYGASFMRCNNEAVPRGTAGRLPWTNSVDLNLAYRPSWAEGLQFKVDVFNAFGSDKYTSVNEIGEDGTTGARSETYLLPASFQAPRSVRFMVQYDF